MRFTYRGRDVDQQQRLEIFKAQTENVRQLERAWSHVNRQINTAILSRNDLAVEINTKLLSVVYCALAEAIFSKLLHTPHGLELAFIDQVKSAAQVGGVKGGWLKCAELAMRDVNGAKSNHSQNVRKKLDELIEHWEVILEISRRACGLLVGWHCVPS